MAAEILGLITDEDGQDVLLHEAAYKGDVQLLRKLLEDKRYTDCINTRVGTFKSTPLRLASTAGHVDCIQILLLHGADVDASDIKAQTPLFEAIKKSNVAACTLLLKAGANPDGNLGNLSSPLHIACQICFTVGIQLLLEYGAAINPCNAAHPLHLALAYNNMEGFALILLHDVDVNKETPNLLHHFVRKRTDTSFIHLWIEFGGSLWHRDDNGYLPADVANATCYECLHQLMETPLSLQSLCRLRIRKCLGRNCLPTLQLLDIPQIIRQFLLYQDIPLIKYIHLLINNTNYKN